MANAFLVLDVVCTASKLLIMGTGALKTLL